MKNKTWKFWLAGGSLIATLLAMGSITLDAHLACSRGQITWICRDLLEPKVTNGYRFTKLIDFAQAIPGEQLISTLLEGREGYLYGQTIDRKAGSISIFRLSKKGQIKILAKITKDGGYGNTNTRDDIEQQLVQDKDGTLYGFLPFGGKLELGSIFKVRPSGQINTLAEFNGRNGAYPIALTLSRDGHLYGLTNSYPRKDISDLGYAFKATMMGELQAIKTISGLGGIMGDYWRRPVPFFQGKDNFFYGSALYGNTIFRVSLSGQFEKIFTLGKYNDRATSYPLALVESHDGYLYGTVFNGGVNENGKLVGAIFRISKEGKEAFKSWPMHIEQGTRSVSLIEAQDKNFYGIGNSLTSEDVSAIYQFTPTGQWKTLVKLINPKAPLRSIIQTRDRALYITAIDSSSPTGGAIYTLTSKP